MDSRRLKLCIVFLFCAEFFYQVQSVTFTTSVSPSPAVIGNTSRHTITCHFSFNTAESFQQLGLYIESTPNLYVGVLFNNDNPLWADTAPENLKNRGYLEGSRAEGFLSLVLNDTVCGDKDVVFLCNLQFNQPGGVKTEQRRASVSVEAAPTAPDDMEFIPRTNPAAQFSTMTFECRGNVGRPAASFQWYRFIGTGAGAGEEITDDRVVQDREALATDGCTYTRRSTLTLNLTGTEVDEKLLVRCRVNHPTQGNPDTTACNDPDKDFCRMSEQISVQYPVTVTITPDTQQSEEGLNLSLTCITRGNPLPFLVEWRQEGQNTTLATGNTLQLTNLSLVDTGSYICTGYNTVVGFNKTHSASVYLSVGGSQSPNTGGPGLLALNWTGTLKDGEPVYACAGGSLLLPWNVTETTEAEGIVDIQWVFSGRSEEMIAMYAMGNFLVTAPFSHRVEHVGKGGLYFNQVTVADSGNYTIEVIVHDSSGTFFSFSRTALVRIGDSLMTTDGELHASKEIRAEWDNSDQQFHVVLSCGTFTYLTYPPFEVEWKLPDGSHVNSTRYKDGSFQLFLTNPVTGGNVTCTIPAHSAATACLPGHVPKPVTAEVAVNSLESRLTVLEAQQTALQAENGHL